MKKESFIMHDWYLSCIELLSYREAGQLIETLLKFINDEAIDFQSLYPKTEIAFMFIADKIASE